MIIKKINNKRGFTLIETFVAVLILVFAVIGPLGLLSRAIADGNYAKNQVAAYYLAQEALELFINQRDRNLQNAGVDWLDGFNFCDENSPCQLWYEDSLLVENCVRDDVDGCRLYIENENKYTHSDNENPPSIFRRYLYLSNIEANKSANLTAVVKWVNKETEVDFTLTTKVFNANYEITE